MQNLRSNRGYTNEPVTDRTPAQSDSRRDEGGDDRVGVIQLLLTGRSLRVSAVSQP